MLKTKRQLHSLILGLLMAALLSFTALAGSGSLQVGIRDESDAPVPGIRVEISQVVKDSALTAEYSQLPLTASQLMADPSSDSAKTVYQHLCAFEIQGEVKQTSAGGVVEFTDLDPGVYLVFDRGSQHVAFHPYLVVMDGGHVSSTPKTSNTDTRTLWVCKLWEDNANAAGRRPAFVAVTLLHDGTALRRVTLNAQNQWQHTFYGLPNQGVYTVQEEPVAGYNAEYFQVIGGWIITNTESGGGGGTPTPPSPGFARVSVRKVWADDNNISGLRPNSVTVQLIRDDTVVQTACLNPGNRWQFTFTALDPTRKYTVKEVPLDGYTAAYSGDASTGITITNSLAPTSEVPDTPEPTPPTPVVPDPVAVDIQLEKVWNDENNAQGKRPDHVVMHLIADGSILSTVRLDEAGDWKGIFKNIPGGLFYSVWEEPVTDYSAYYFGSALEGFRVENVLTAGTTEPGIPSEPTPGVPVEPADPVRPVESQIPQTGAELLPVYLLLVLGTLLTAAGLWLLRKQVEP